MVLIPGLDEVPKLVSIPKVPSLLAILTFPPVVGFAVNGCNEYPYLGSVFNDPSLLNPTKLLSCQYLRTPVVWS